MQKKVIASFIVLFLSLLFLNYDCLSFFKEVSNKLQHFVYPLDDSYIHLSISKNLAESSVWGSTQYEFSNTSSSPLFTIIIALLIKIFGNNDLIPFYFNMIIGNLLIIFLYLNFRKYPIQLALLYLLLFWGVLIKIQIVSGMEHMLHIFIISVSWISFYNWIQTSPPHTQNTDNQLYRIIFYTTLPFLCTVRYESLFLITPIILILLLNKKIKDSIITAALSISPVFLFGIYSIYNGGHFFPNSLLIKGNHEFSLSSILKYFSHARFIITGNIFYLCLILIILLFIFNNKTTKNIDLFIKNKLVYFIILSTTLGHLMFAKTNWLYRYDAYLIALLIISVMLLTIKVRIKTLHTSSILVGSILFLISTDAFIDRKRGADKILKYASKNIHDQQIQMAIFLKKYFNNATVIANDIGAICYYTNIKLIDVVGLGSNKVTNIKLTKDTDKLNYFFETQEYDIMVVYDSWIDIKKDTRLKVAELEISDNHICGDSKVSFYIPKNTSNKEYTYRSLEEFKTNHLSNIKGVHFTIYKQ